tara:strand:+ start:30120 stop:31193 length:1074 start_codon:yes stop_codon:yes gene_type:complete
LWVKSTSILDSSSVDSVFNFAVKNNINKLFYQVRYRGDALYNSNLVPKHEKLDSLFDPLNYILQKTDSTDIEIHAWFNTYILWSSDKKPIDGNHLYFNCDQCFEVDLNGKSDISIPLHQIHSKSWEGIYLSPLNPDVNTHLLNVVNELISNYKIHGIHLDYIRYQDNFYGYNQYGLNEFENQYSINPIDLKRGIISERFGYSKSYVDSMNTNWEKFKSSKITEFVRSIKYLLLSNSLDLKVSAAVKPDILEAKYRWYQDWESWINEDIIDFCVIMNYYDNFEKYNNINRIINSKNLNKDKISIGISVFNQNQTEISNKILLSRFEGFKKFALFPYELEKDTINWYESIYNTLNFYID